MIDMASYCLWNWWIFNFTWWIFYILGIFYILFLAEIPQKLTREDLRYSKKNGGLKITVTFYTNPFWRKESLKVKKWNCKKTKSMKMVIKKRKAKRRLTEKLTWQTSDLLQSTLFMNHHPTKSALFM